MEKLELTFQRGEILSSAIMNRVTGKIDELVQASNDNDFTKVESGGTGTVTKQLSPNVFYTFGEVASLTVTLKAGTPGTFAEYMFEFQSGGTATTLSLPESVKWIGDHKVEANTSYQVSIANNVAVMGGFKK